MIVIVIYNSEMSDSSMESCSSEDDISSSEPRPVEVSKEGSVRGIGIGREKGSGRGRCIEVAVVNAYTIHKYQATQGKKLTHLACHRQLIEALSPSAPPKRGQSTTSSVEKLQSARQYTAKGESRLDCVVRSRRGESRVRHLTAYTCGTCSSRSFPCPAPGFEDYIPYKEKLSLITKLPYCFCHGILLL